MIITNKMVEDAIAACCGCECDECKESLKNSLTAALASHEAQGVAWQCQGDNGKWYTMPDGWEPAAKDTARALYTRAPDVRAETIRECAVLSSPFWRAVR